MENQLKSAVDETFLPMLRSHIRHFGRSRIQATPLFPSYIFARFNFQKRYFDVKYSPGVHSLVLLGAEPVEVSDTIVDEIRHRGRDGIVEILPPPFDLGQRIQILDGPFRGIEAIFDGYLSGSERVTILLQAVNNTVRVVLPTKYVASAEYQK